MYDEKINETFMLYGGNAEVRSNPAWWGGEPVSERQNLNYQTCCLLTKGEKCLETRQTKSKIKDIFLNYNLGGYTTIILLLNMKQF